MPCRKHPTAGDARAVAPRAWPRPAELPPPAPKVDPVVAAREGIEWTRSERVDDGATELVVAWEAECRVAGLCPGRGRARLDYRDGSPYHQAAAKVGAMAELDRRRARIVELAERTAKRRALHSIGLDCGEAIELVGGDS